MKLNDCFSAALTGYAAIILGCVVLGALYLIIPFPPELFYWAIVSAVLVAPLVMGVCLGRRWPQPTIAFDEMLPACLKTLLIFGVPWLIIPPIVPFYLLALPFTVCGVVFGAKIGISTRHHRLIEELLGRWSIGEK